MKKSKIFVAIVSVFVTLPIWYFLLYTILTAIHADRLVWFLYYVYLPVGFLVTLLDKLTKDN